MSVFWSGGVGPSHMPSTSDAETRGRARSADMHAREAEERLDRAMLACEAMWTLLRDKLGLTDLQLIERINEIDLSDGKLDGKVRKSAVACPKCKRTIARRFNKCMYCGQAIQQDPFA